MEQQQYFRTWVRTNKCNPAVCTDTAMADFAHKFTEDLGCIRGRDRRYIAKYLVDNSMYSDKDLAAFFCLYDKYELTMLHNKQQALYDCKIQSLTKCMEHMSSIMRKKKAITPDVLPYLGQDLWQKGYCAVTPVCKEVNGKVAYAVQMNGAIHTEFIFEGTTIEQVVNSGQIICVSDGVAYMVDDTVSVSNNAFILQPMQVGELFSCVPAPFSTIPIVQFQVTADTPVILLFAIDDTRVQIGGVSTV